MSSKRPFFSLVIPCYNDGRYAPGKYIDRLLSNIKDQGLEKDDIEIIISDDKSPIPYHNTLAKYQDDLTIRFISTEVNSGPGVCRDRGASAATGQWLCFADHDDKFYPNVLPNVKDIILKTNESLFVYSDFNKVNYADETDVVEEFRSPNLSTWIHGKFYNIDNLWRKFDVHFLPELRTHEDIALGKIIDCILHNLKNPKCTYIKTPVYMWFDDPRSTSNSQYVSKDNHPFIELYFEDFLTSKIVPYLVCYEKNQITLDEARFMTLLDLFSTWFNIQTFKTNNPDNYLKCPEAYCSKMWHTIKDKLNLTPGAAKVISAELGNLKNNIDATALKYGYPNLNDWIDILDTMDYSTIIVNEKLTMLQADECENATHRPFFSIVIPCYNDGRYKKGCYLDRLLNSLTKQNVPKQDMEVILSDDCSPCSFDDIIEPYLDSFIIKRIKTDYNCCPGNTRARGVEIATGQWLCFADHDDIYYDNALEHVMRGIIEKNETRFAFGDFYGVDLEGKITRNFEKNLNWCHGKFYNMDNFWKPQNIHFIPDLKSHEDIAICTQVACAIHKLNMKEITYFHFPVYAWTDNPQSVSHAKYTTDTETGQREFLEVFLDDYIHSTGYIYLDQFKTHEIKITYAIKSCLEIMLYCYFYTQGFQFRRPLDFYRKNLVYSGEFVRLCKKTFTLTNDTIYNAVASGNAAMYYDIRNYADPGSGHYIPTQTFRQWLDLVSDYFE